MSGGAFVTRAKVISSFRRQLEARDFIEVETPMMQSLYGGAAARPFVTHHNALDIDLYLRVAPELYLKRLVVGGLERVYEINKNFRNEGISTQHNPEFTMLEFYQAYTDYRGLMDLTGDLLRQIAIDATGSTQVEYEGQTMDFDNIRRFSMREAVVEFWVGADKPTLDNLRDPEWLARHSSKYTPGERLVDIFERVCEKHLHPADHHLRLPCRNVAAVQEQARRTRVRREIRDLHRRHGDRQRVHRVERSAGAAPSV